VPARAFNGWRRTRRHKEYEDEGVIRGGMNSGMKS